ncbi:ubiquitin specific peptidase-like protein [Camelus ferus]|nr:ubiquitin specific peptidase-like protein [Camelus ferus]
MCVRRPEVPKSRRDTSRRSRVKGKLKALKTYRISFQESIFLCEDLQCIYPLGSRSLNNLISPDLEDCHTVNKPQKRKILETDYKDSPLLANSKKTKNPIGINGEQVLNSQHNGGGYDGNSSDLPGLLHGGQQNPVRTADSLEQNEILEADTVDMAAEEDSATVNVSDGTFPQNEGCTSELEMPSESRRTSFCQTSCVQWKNTHALCWLDCILSALVHLEGLKTTVTGLCSEEESVFRQLFTKYNQASELLDTNQLDGVKGSWLECDDLKGPCSEKHEKFEVPSSEIHIVIWERKTSQMTDKASACCLLKKTNEQHDFGDEKQVSPASCSVGDAASAQTSTGNHPTDVSIAPNTLSQDEAVALGHHLLSDPKGLVDNILPLTLEEIQVNSEGFLLEHKPVAGNTGVVETNTLQLRESVMASLVSAPCKDKLAQDHFVDLNFSSPLVNTNMTSLQLNTEDAVVSKSVNGIHATDPIQGVKSAETERTVALEKDSPPKQFLSPKPEKLKPEQRVISQVSNLKEKETAALSKSLQNPSLKENQKKPFVGSWVKGLLSKGASFMPPCVSAHNRNTITDLQPSVKGASNFGGFKTKGTKQKANRASRKAHRCAGKPPPVGNPSPSHSSSVSTASLQASSSGDSEVPKKCGNTSYGANLNHSSHGNENGVSAANHGDPVEGQIHKLRLKLLKKLKAKKKKLTALMSFPQNGTLPSENSEHVSHCGSPDDCESIEDLLKELQYQIDIADSKSECTTVSSVSPYKSQTHEEILAELLSPTTIVSTELSENGETDFRYLEMGDNHIPAPVPNELNNIPQNTHLRQDHNYCSPTKKNQCGVQPDSLTNNADVRTLNSESPMKADIFDEFFSTSALNSLANDSLDLPHFDEYLFDSC